MTTQDKLKEQEPRDSKIYDLKTSSKIYETLRQTRRLWHIERQAQGLHDAAGQAQHYLGNQRQLVFDNRDKLAYCSNSDKLAYLWQLETNACYWNSGSSSRIATTRDKLTQWAPRTEARVFITPQDRLSLCPRDKLRGFMSPSRQAQRIYDTSRQAQRIYDNSGQPHFMTHLEASSKVMTQNRSVYDNSRTKLKDLWWKAQVHLETSSIWQD
jgi:hypothetical protein